MIEFQHIITDPLGLHARPAGQLAQKASAMTSTVTLSAKGKQVNAKQVIALMRLCLKTGDTVAFQVDGQQEAGDAAALKEFCENTL